MNDTEIMIADIVAGMDFSRKKPVSEEAKQQTAALYQDLGETLKKLHKLHLSLWYASQNNDYRSLPLQQAKEKLAEAVKELEMLI